MAQTPWVIFLMSAALLSAACSSDDPQNGSGGAGQGGSGGSGGSGGDGGSGGSG
ncbi:MAG: hypothetical protein HUU21_35610, partial [Polyangiaceae bacterium]|nr:hypothetical protein [Polyangiaceae bacterium]